MEMVFTEGGSIGHAQVLLVFVDLQEMQMVFAEGTNKVFMGLGLQYFHGFCG